MPEEALAGDNESETNDTNNSSDNRPTARAGGSSAGPAKTDSTSRQTGDKKMEVKFKITPKNLAAAVKPAGGGATSQSQASAKPSAGSAGSPQATQAHGGAKTPPATQQKTGAAAEQPGAPRPTTTSREGAQQATQESGGSEGVEGGEEESEDEEPSEGGAEGKEEGGEEKNENNETGGGEGAGEEPGAEPGQEEGPGKAGGGEGAPGQPGGEQPGRGQSQAEGQQGGGQGGQEQQDNGQQGQQQEQGGGQQGQPGQQPVGQPGEEEKKPEDDEDKNKDEKEEDEESEGEGEKNIPENSDLKNPIADEAHNTEPELPLPPGAMADRNDQDFKHEDARPPMENADFLKNTPPPANDNAEPDLKKQKALDRAKQNWGGEAGVHDGGENQDQNANKDAMPEGSKRMEDEEGKKKGAPGEVPEGEEKEVEREMAEKKAKASRAREAASEANDNISEAFEDAKQKFKDIFRPRNWKYSILKMVAPGAVATIDNFFDVVNKATLIDKKIALLERLVATTKLFRKTAAIGDAFSLMGGIIYETYGLALIVFPAVLFLGLVTYIFGGKLAKAVDLLLIPLEKSLEELKKKRLSVKNATENRRRKREKEKTAENQEENAKEGNDQKNGREPRAASMPTASSAPSAPSMKEAA